MSAADNERLINGFYEAFARRDGDAMAACYGDAARFSDPVFPGLDAREVRAMWRMLTRRAKDLVVVHRGVSATETEGRAHWEATYTFSATGRRVHNVIDATFRFAGGAVVEHVDVFDFWRWSRMALGAPGVLLGWSGPLRRKVQRTARAGLDAFLAAEASPRT